MHFLVPIKILYLLFSFKMNKYPIKNGTYDIKMEFDDISDPSCRSGNRRLALPIK